MNLAAGQLRRAGSPLSAAGAAVDTLAPRWRGQRDRLEVWYATLSDPVSGAGAWVHHEVVAPVTEAPYVHGWAAVFRAGEPPVLERFGPEPVPAARRVGALASVAGAQLDPPVVRGQRGRLAWDLRLAEEPAGDSPQARRDAPLFTFPAWAWEREALPAAQVLPTPSASVSGTLSVDGGELTLSPEARGNLAHIYGRGSAERWGWLHAELGGGVLEVVSAVSRRPGLNHLPPLAFVQLRLGAHDWPRDPMLAAPLFRSHLALPTWSVKGTVGRWRLRTEVTIEASKAVSVGYVDPDGTSSTCTNSEIADADIVLEHRRSRWEVEAHWTLRGTAHAEIGTRP